MSSHVEAQADNNSRTIVIFDELFKYISLLVILEA